MTRSKIRNYKKTKLRKSLIRSKQTGAALLEAIVALSAVVVAVAGISVVITASVSNAQFIQDQNRANKYAQEGIEYLRSYKERSYSDFINDFSFLDSRCLDKNFRTDTAGTDPNCTNSRIGDDGNEKFVRKVTVASNTNCTSDTSDPAYEVTVSVEWQSSKCDVDVDPFCHSSEVRTCFTPPAFSNVSLDFGPTEPPVPPTNTPTRTPTQIPPTNTPTRTPSPTPTTPACLPIGGLCLTNDSLCCSGRCNLLCASNR